MSTVYIARSREVAGRRIGGELMILSARTSQLFSLNEVAAVIWQQADGVTPLDQIVERFVCTEFEIDPAAALRDVQELVEGLAKHGILTVSNTPIVEML